MQKMYQAYYTFFIECGGEDTTAGMPQMMVSSPIVKVMNTEAFNSKWYNIYNTSVK
ncbi:MAG: hypothetical protein M3342_15000 [Bacteroidota bacterium]|nr:hypothetical protein [Flavisolibacter sp.]MDQ3845300.1 hypothetical protein [Bacteroidota bacterium]